LEEQALDLFGRIQIRPFVVDLSMNSTQASVRLESNSGVSAGLSQILPIEDFLSHLNQNQSPFLSGITAKASRSEIEFREFGARRHLSH
jgi:hypothetical protein